MKRLLLAVVSCCLAAVLALPAAVGWLAGQAQKRFLLERNPGGAALPTLREPGWLSSRYGWTLDRRWSRHELRHELRHGPWLTGAEGPRLAWLAGRLHFDGAEDGLAYRLGLGGQLAAEGRLDRLGFVDEVLGAAELRDLDVSLLQQAGALALDLEVGEAVWKAAESAAWRLHGLHVNMARSALREASREQLDLRLSAARLDAGAWLWLHGADLILAQRKQQDRIELGLELSADRLVHGLLDGRVHGRLALAPIDASALARIRAAGAQASDPAAVRQAQLAQLLAELPVLAQAQPELRVDGLRLQAEDGSLLRLDGRARLKPPRRMAIGTGWIAGMFEAELRLGIDQTLLERLTSDDNGPLRQLDAWLRAAIETGTMVEQGGRWRLRLRFAEGRWAPLED